MKKTAPRANDDSPEMPHAVEVEQAIIGILLADASTLDKHADVLDPEIFYDPLHQRIVAKARERWTEGKSVTPLTIAESLANDPGLAEVGGQDYLQNLRRAAPTWGSIPDYCAILRDRAMRRQIIAVGENLAEMGRDVSDDDPATDIARRGADALCDVGGAGDVKPPRAMVDVAYESMKRVENALKGEKTPRVPSGLAQLDDLIGGFHAGDLIIAAGRPGMGKSAIAAGLSLRAALFSYPTMVFSHEMTAQQWSDRNICDLDFDVADPKKPLWYEKLRRANVTGDELERATIATQRLQGLPYDILDDDRLTVEDIVSRSRAFKAKFPPGQIGMIVVDYLQKVPVPYRRDRIREQEVSHVAKGLKSLAKQLGWPVLAMAQISREADKRSEDSRRPSLADLRESGSIEQEADMVFFPYRPAYYVEQKRPGSDAGEPAVDKYKRDLAPVKHKFELLCRKNRHGRTFDLHLWCEIGANAIRDEEPVRRNVDAAALAQDSMI